MESQVALSHSSGPFSWLICTISEGKAPCLVRREEQADTMVTDTFQYCEIKQELRNLCFKAKLYIGAAHA